MKEPIEGIFLKKINYSDYTNILYIYTSEYGILSFIQKCKKKNNSNALLVPLNIVDITFRYAENKNFQHIQSINNSYLLFSIRENIYKLHLVQFMADFLYQLITYPQKDKELFDAIKNWTLFLEKASSEYIKLWHIYGLLQLTTYFGIRPTINFSEHTPYFDLQNAAFSNKLSSYSLTKNISYYWAKIFTSNIENLKHITISKNDKNELIQSIINYYSIQTHKTINVNSLPIFQELYA